MKKNFLLSILTAVFTAFFNLIFPWYAFIIPLIVLYYLIPVRPIVSFLIGFSTVFLLYVGYAWWLDHANQGILSQRIGILFGNLSGFTLALLSGLTGGLLGGFAALTGRLLSDNFKNKH
jgi:presenilin-like A22 family membrane protease